jgi:hypothetical protein
MTHEIPLEPLLRRLAETPFEFLGEPKIGPLGDVFVAALVHDLLVGLGLGCDIAFLKPFGADVKPQRRNAHKLVMISVWLLSDPRFADMPLSSSALRDLLTDLIPAMAAQGRADKYVEDSERREELVRAVLNGLNCLPEGETHAQATDRLSRISSTQRQRLLAASRAAEERARDIREALARKAAQESADKWTRE